MSPPASSSPASAPAPGSPPAAPARRWDVAAPDRAAVDTLARTLGVDPLTATLLVNRGLRDPGEARRFLRPRLADMADPSLLEGIDEAVERIVHALNTGETICVWGDYDVDGVTSAAQLVWFFRALGVAVRTFVPDRFVEGYGLHAGRLRELARQGVGLFIAVDCGIRGVEAVAAAREEGADVIVVDHHELPDVLPDAAAVVDPKRPGCAYPDAELAACGVTWLLLVALRRRLRQAGVFRDRPEPDLRRWLDLVGVGTVADVVPLRGLNRVFVRAGLPLLGPRAARPGLAALWRVSDLGERTPTAGRVGFQLGPRLNAAGRLAHADAGLELLTTEDPARAEALAEEVDALNVARQDLQRQVFEEACALVEGAAHRPPERRAIVLAAPGWHPGVLGIVASRVAERYHRPTILLRAGDGPDDDATGSGRSVPGFRLVRELERVAELLTRFGGHDHAAGVTLPTRLVPELARRLDAQARAGLDERHLQPRLRVDAEVSLGEDLWTLAERVQELAPFGAGNPEPCFVARGVIVRDALIIGKDRTHLRLRLQDPGGGPWLEAIAFSMASRRPRVGAVVDVAYVPELNTYKGRTRLQLRLKDLRTGRD